jgi:hypothetical protein
MNPKRLLRRLCARHGLPWKEGEPLVPLVQRALESPDGVRDRILALVEGNLARRGKGNESVQKLFEDLDQEVLLAVAKILHPWKPSHKVLELGHDLPPFFQQGLGEADFLGGSPD